ncbi:glycine betaine ABC transporter substrate-binding protein [Rivibacter subsaxonicus]|uniref:Osmoprotectant transport system permease protein n=1 Tax=Rivibacter subsaxonicus TaxID=457575 RepID=A0A4Q7VCY4_9BURK|nr:glycine betaine ABC transporter substrate-binding protein [Rivibacter subsaxonicus]RZT93747.1 osmoprotectant transport system permease protein [Rivibacter subsaxonicus]
MKRTLALLLLGALAWTAAQAAPVQVGSKRFTESYVLGQIVAETLAQQGIAAEHRPGLGNTAVLEQALASGAIDVYPEYTGTIVRELLKREGKPTPTLDELNRWLAPRGLKAAVPLGFNNSYALALREADAQRLGLDTLSELGAAKAGGLRLGLSHEFLGRADGWPALKRAYGLPFDKPLGLDHGLAYAALEQGQVDLIDIYTTDAKIARAGIRVLRDDRGFFPRYDAVLLMRAGLDEAPLRQLAGRLDEARMIALNAAVELDGRTYAEVAREFVAGLDGSAGAAATRPGFMARLFGEDFWRLTRQHLLLVFGSLALAVAVGVPLGVLAWQRPVLAQPLLGAVGLIQTIPSLALLAFLIALIGTIGFWPALAALFLYALLPIVANTHAGLAGVGRGLRDAATALGLRPAQRLRHVELPLALPVLLAGVQTAAVINVGTATMAAFVGAGGYGERIVSGLALNDTAVLLSGAVPAAALAVLVQGGFGLLRRRLGAVAGQRAETIPAR